jgi:hypothetical protein
MIYLTFDTCIWLELLKADIHVENNVFEETLYWIENGEVICITTVNMIREWDRNKILKKDEILKGLKKVEQMYSDAFKADTNLKSLYKPDIIEAQVTKRIDRLDAMFRTIATIAPESQAVYDEAIKRNLDCLAPNHQKDSFRDSINIISLIHFLKANSFGHCYFSTINYTDFSNAKDKKHELHPHLKPGFDTVDLEYIYFDDYTDNYGGRLFNTILRPTLPSFSDYLQEMKKKAQAALLEEKKQEQEKRADLIEPEYLENLPYLDMILSKPSPNAVEKQLLAVILKQHPAYEQYFIKNLSTNGLV